MSNLEHTGIVAGLSVAGAKLVVFPKTPMQNVAITAAGAAIVAPIALDLGGQQKSPMALAAAEALIAGGICKYAFGQKLPECAKMGALVAVSCYASGMVYDKLFSSKHA